MQYGHDKGQKWQETKKRLRRGGKNAQKNDLKKKKKKGLIESNNHKVRSLIQNHTYWNVKSSGP